MDHITAVSQLLNMPLKLTLSAAALLTLILITVHARMLQTPPLRLGHTAATAPTRTVPLQLQRTT